MNYANGKKILLGDIVKLHSGLGQFVEGQVVKIIISNTADSREWSAPKGGFLIQGAGLGLSLWTSVDEDLVFVKRAKL